ncbi:MAG: hypothetical protein ABI203_12145, partial [Mucilaginibacter sp.]
MRYKTITIFFTFFVTAILPIKIFAQVFPNLQNSFNQYSANTFQEKLFVHTDKNTYVAGELIWFKIYDVDGINNCPTDVSKVAYVEILSNNKDVILQAKIDLKKGKGSGSLLIPVTALSGNYLLRAYTNWMKNFSADYYFNKQVTIINPLKSPENAKNVAEPKYDLQFFPEGGNMVNGMANLVAFKATDQWGKSVNFKGFVINKQNDTILRFEPFKFGMGRFTFKPEKNNAYRAVIKIGSKTIQQSLPPINDNGYLMNLKDLTNGTILVTVNTNSESGTVYLFAHTRNVIKVGDAAVIENGTANFIIDKTKLGDGISHFTVFDNDKRPVCERLYFKRPSKNLFIEATTDRQQYAMRRQVTVTLDAKNTENKPITADLSMSVYRIDSLQHPYQDDIQSYFWLCSDLKGYIESPEYYFENSDSHADEAVDNLMLTQGWSRFNWDNLLQGKTPAFSFLPEYNGPIVTAQITNTLTNKPAPGIMAYLTIPGKRIQMYTSASDSLGHL